MFIHDVLIHADQLLNGRSITQVSEMALVEYFHVKLDRHAIIIAEGAPTESYAELNNRRQFQNVAEYFGLCPDALAETPPFCAPLVEYGALLEELRMGLAQRAGLLGADAALATGELLGHLDHLGNDVAEGWALDNVNRNVPICLEVYEDGKLIARTTADRYRPDLANAGVCQGRAGFKVKLPAAYATSANESLTCAE